MSQLLRHLNKSLFIILHKGESAILADICTNFGVLISALGISKVSVHFKIFCYFQNALIFSVFLNNSHNYFKAINAIIKTVLYWFSWRVFHNIFIMVIKNFDRFLFIIDKFLFALYSYRIT